MRFDFMKQEASSKFSSSKTSRISLIDLAGADRNKLDDVGRQSAKEGKYVRKTLSQLGYKSLTNILNEDYYKRNDQQLCLCFIGAGIW